MSSEELLWPHSCWRVLPEETPLRPLAGGAVVGEAAGTPQKAVGREPARGVPESCGTTMGLQQAAPVPPATWQQMVPVEQAGE